MRAASETGNKSVSQTVSVLREELKLPMCSENAALIVRPYSCTGSASS